MYEIFYGFKAKPFRFIPGTKCFFLSQSHKKALTHLRAGLAKAEGIIVVTGAEGSGKSSLFSVLAKELETRKIHLVEIRNTEGIDDVLVETILKAFGGFQSGIEKSQLIKQLLNAMTAVAVQGKHCVLMIDAAQKLNDRSLEFLRLLTECQFDNKRMAQLVLIGDDSLNRRLNEEHNLKFHQQIVSKLQIESMQPEDAKQYILYRLKCVGWKGSPKIHDTVFDRIFQLTEGVPAKINEFCDRLLMQSMQHEKQFIDTYDIEMLLLQNDMTTTKNNTYTSYAQKPSIPEVSATETVSEEKSEESEPDIKIQVDLDRHLSDAVVTIESSIGKNQKLMYTLLCAYSISLLVAVLVYAMA